VLILSWVALVMQNVRRSLSPLSSSAKVDDPGAFSRERKRHGGDRTAWLSMSDSNFDVRRENSSSLRRREAGCRFSDAGKINEK
jgi:hypothetical protein